MLPRPLRFPLHSVLRAALLGVLIASLSSSLSSCTSTPTLPLPPPVATIGTPNQQGLVRVEGQANEDAYVSVLNETTEQGVFRRADANGHFAIDIAASIGDDLSVWQFNSTVQGERTMYTVPAPE